MSDNQGKSEYEQDFTPKTANRKINKGLLITLAIVIVLIGLGIAGYFIYEGSFYYQTDNAKVDALVYQLTPTASGKLEKLYVSQDEDVSSGQVLAQVENGSLIRSPIDGTVINIAMQEGDYVTPADVVLVVAIQRIFTLRQMWKKRISSKSIQGRARPFPWTRMAGVLTVLLMLSIRSPRPNSVVPSPALPPLAHTPR